LKTDVFSVLLGKHSGENSAGQPLALIFFFNLDPFNVARFLKGFAQLLQVRSCRKPYEKPNPGTATLRESLVHID
jgi:hypothetical protein